jgi:hypothetical protein
VERGEGIGVNLILGESEGGGGEKFLEKRLDFSVRDWRVPLRYAEVVCAWACATVNSFSA